MPTFYNFTQSGNIYSFDDIFVPADLFRDGNLFTWGSNGSRVGFVNNPSNDSGQLGNNSTVDRSTPVTTLTGGSNWKQISCKSNHTAAIKTDGTLWTWGNANNGKLGNAVTTNVFTPVTTFAGGTNWKQVSAGGEHTVAIKTDGTLWTWGASGQIGIGVTTGFRSTPVTTFAGGTNWKQVSAGYDHQAAIKTDGTLWTWGETYSGTGVEFVRPFTVKLGIGDGNRRSTPVTTFAGGNNWKQVSCGDKHMAAIKTDGTLWTWGDNTAYGGPSGFLGTNDTINRSTPVTTFAGGTNWKQVSCNGFGTFAIKTDGTLWTWGNGTSGRLGNNAAGNISTPVTTFAGGTNWKQVSAGYEHTAAIKTDGTLWTWGGNSYGNGFIVVTYIRGRLGTNDSTNRVTPVTTFAGGTNWKQVSAGRDHTAAVTYIDPVI